MQRMKEMPQESRWRRFSQQFSALMYKNAIVSIRRPRPTILLLFSPLFFMLLIFGVDRALQASRRGMSSYKDVKFASAIDVLPVADCNSAFFIREPCFDFVWSGNSSAIATQIVSKIMTNNPGRQIPQSRVLSFASTGDADQWLLKNPLKCPVALHLEERPRNLIAYGIQMNSTTKTIRGNDEDPVFKFQLPLQSAAEREISRYLTRDPNLSWRVSFAEFPHPARSTFSTVGAIGPTFLLAAIMFGFVIQLTNLVAEKELKLRQAMSVMGLMDSAYWLTWLTWGLFQSLISSLIIVLSGMAFQFSFFLDNNFALLFLLFFLFTTNMVGYSFMLSTFVKRAASANTVGFVVFVIGFVTQLVTIFGFPYSDSYSKLYQVVWSFFPTNLFATAMDDLGKATSGNNNGYKWADRSHCAPGETGCVITLEEVFNWLIATWFLWIVLAIYFDNIIPDANGVRKTYLYFLRPSYWMVNSREQDLTGCCRPKVLPPPPPSTIVDDDVAAEEEMVRQSDVDSSVALQVRGLVRTFPGSWKKARWCICKKMPPQHAVQGSWFSIERGKLFCLLGANGAGKTTTINCLTGILPVTDGNAFVYGESIRSTRSMSRIRSFMGVCPQFDILWDSLTGREHLRIFAKIKGLDPPQIPSKVEEMLDKVKLVQAGDTRSESYSGGMKRRLSVAISLIGDPKILYLDEPTTGMDPIMRRHLWDVIEDAKKGCAIILTTHSMEEADILSDKIAIMAKGKIQCIGSSIHLKYKFGTGYMVSVGFLNGYSADIPPEVQDEERLKRAAVKSFFRQDLGLEPHEETKAYLTYAVPQKQENIADFFEKLSIKTSELGITDIQLGLTTLEEVFLAIAKRAELQNSEGRLEQLSLPNGIILMVPVGTQHFPVPGTATNENPLGMSIEIFWEPDENGSLIIRDFSEMRPVIPSLTLTDENRSVNVHDY